MPRWELAKYRQKAIRLLFGLFAFRCPGMAVPGLPFAAEAQQVKLPRSGFLANHSASRPEYQTFLQTLRELGYVEGKNIAIEARYAQGNFDRLPELARELVRLEVDLLFVSGDQGVKPPSKQLT